ncbi:GNAT family N-acetyltransferase [Streptomyces sp. NPDC097619]|uniref:GNAT family N-acetyltransferase n=1 Tax=Streptomyces sp. NPDC097619 TaxID=3157228 RepID=UPI00331FFD4B
MSANVRVEKIGPGNIDAALALRVLPEQEKNVAPVVKSLAEAYAWGETAWPRLLLDGDEAVGFLMLFVDIAWNPDADPEDRRSGLWRLNIAAGHQGKGYGRYAVEAGCAEVRRRGGDRFFTTWEPGPTGPGEFYRRLGFTPTGETSGGQIVGVRELG